MAYFVQCECLVTIGAKFVLFHSGLGWVAVYEHSASNIPCCTLLLVNSYFGIVLERHFALGLVRILSGCPLLTF